jgi:hypothetical protein
MPPRYDTIDEQRTYWREKARRKYWANLERERTYRRQQVRKRAGHPLDGPLPPRPALPPRSVHCKECGIEFRTPRTSERVYCSPEHRAAGTSEARHRPRPQMRTAFPLCRIGYGNCPECSRFFVIHGSRRRFCSDRCQTRRSSREYQRRTHATAIRYWRVAPTPDAQALAATYFELRQELRQSNR